MYTSTYVHRLLFRDIFIYTEIGKPQHGFFTAKCVFEQKSARTEGAEAFFCVPA